ncbi:MAG: branched-chain amino acid ABC transporter permease [Verrucomicrobia bacterium]|nr:branched-chain amino acid ABC transporter permease [Verrucomicrobiota bacterium]
MDYLLHILIVACCYTILAVSLGLIAGHAGLLALAHAGFYGLGAYTSALLAIHTGAPFWLSVPAGMALAALVSLAVSLPSLRLHEDYFAIATFGFQMILFSVFNNWSEVTGGSMGIAGIPRAKLFGFTIESQLGYVFLAIGLAAFTCVVVRRLTTSPFGRVLRAIREDEPFATSLGKNTLRFKVTAFAVAAALAASAGGLYAHYNSYVDPSSFTVMESILVVSMVVIGGAGSLWGPIVGAFVLVALPEALRFVGLPIGIAANVRQMMYGTLLVAVVMFRPRGLFGKYSLGR